MLRNHRAPAAVSWSPFWLLSLRPSAARQATRAVGPGSAAAVLTDVPWYRRVWAGMEVGPTGGGGWLRRPWRHPLLRTVRRPRDRPPLCSRRLPVRCYLGPRRQLRLLRFQSGPEMPRLGARDPLREAVDEARRQKLPIIAYCVLQQEGIFSAPIRNSPCAEPMENESIASATIPATWRS